MNTEILPHVFASVTNLEIYLENIKAILSNHNDTEPQLLQSITQYGQIVKKMRRAANKLQLEMAKNDWNATVRSLRIIYGLNQMVRTDIIATYITLSKGEVGQENVSTIGTEVFSHIH